MMIPRFEWGEDDELELTLPMLPWTYGQVSLGGSDVSAAGLPASFAVREQETLGLRLRVTEDEWPDVLAFMRVGMVGTELTWFPDKDESESTTIFFEEPRTGDMMTVERDTFERVLIVSLTVRKTDATDFSLAFYVDDEP